jgi:hypothetical protein
LVTKIEVKRFVVDEMPLSVQDKLYESRQFVHHQDYLDWVVEKYPEDDHVDSWFKRHGALKYEKILVRNAYGVA